MDNSGGDCGALADLHVALRDALDRSGALRKLQALARAEALRALSPRPGGGGGTLQPPEPACETLLINELIREYLIFHGYRATLSVFVPESGAPAARPFGRAGLRAAALGGGGGLGTTAAADEEEGPNAARVPLLYSLLAARQQPAGAGVGAAAATAVAAAEPPAHTPAPAEALD